ncbi:hypothetical protein [Candidatus Electronema sp. PJ]|uniref:hypothetical protein n=1 Tax=Candidatus Electronema sp. PJ TaxID=3401572 RepID=UPI003AA801D2
MLEEKKQKNVVIYNLLFVAVCAGIVLVLWKAPPETTPHLPNDEPHKLFLEMEKKEAEKHCGECHGEGKHPLPKEHPPTYRCLFCHKRP